MQSSFTIHSQLVVSLKLLWWKLEKSKTRKKMRHLGPLRRFPWEIIGWRNWVQKLLDKQKTTNQPNQTLIQFEEQGDLSWQNKRPVRVFKKSIHFSLLTARIPTCLFDTDTDKDVDADRIRTGRPVVIGQPTSSSTQFEEVDIVFGVSGLPHAVVKQAENARVRQLVKKIESHLHRQDLQADLQQNNAYNPFSEKSKKMIRDTGNIELFELCETSWSAMQRMPSLLESRHRLLHLRASLERESIQSK